jgi:hypothetical protein
VIKMHATEKNEKKRGINPVAAGAAGFIAGVVGATALAMKDEVVKNRAKQKLNEAKKAVNEKAEEVKNKIVNTTEKVEEKGKEVSNKIKDEMEEV